MKNPYENQNFEEDDMPEVYINGVLVKIEDDDEEEEEENAGNHS